MREIEFRAYNQHGEKMFSWEDIKKEAKHITEMENIICLPLLKHVKYMQYTGLKDKNGVEIYEGDIVKIKDNGDTKYEIKWVNSRCSFEIFTISPRKDEWENAKFDEDEDPKLCEVIGNIYESPELLEA